MKKTLIFLVVAIFAVSIVFVSTSCKEKTVSETISAEETEASAEETTAEAEETTTAAESSDKPYAGTTIKAITFQMTHQQAIADLIPRFEEATGIDVVFDMIPYNDVREKMITMAASHTYEYDVLWLDTIWVAEFANSGYLYDVTDWVERDWDEIDVDDIPENFWDNCSRYNGRWIGLPNSGHYGIFAYRTDLFDQFGLVPPETMQDLMEISKTLTTEIDGKQIYGTAFRYARGAYIASDFFHFSGAYADYDNVYYGWFHPDMTPAFNEPAMLEALNAYFAFYEEGLVPPGSENFEFTEIMNAFNNGDVGTILTETWAVASLLDPELSNFSDKVGTYVPPGCLKEDGSVKKVPYSGGTYPYSISVDSPNKEAAWEFIKWAASKEIQEDYINTGGEPVRISVMNDPAMQEKYPHFKYYEEIINTSDYRPLIPEYPEVLDIIGLELSKALIGEITKEEALDKINTQVYEIMENAGYF